jgi:hypothetical protein
VNFRQQQSEITDYFKDNYKDYLPAGAAEPTFTTDFLDFDKHKGDFTFFIDFNRITFPTTSYEDDCENVEQLALTVYLAFRNDRSEALRGKMLDASWAFYKMAGESSIEELNDFSIESIDFYDYVEGNKFLVMSEISCSLNINTER